MGDKGALRRAGQALKVDAKTIGELSKKIRTSLDDIDSKEHKELIELAKKFKGTLEVYGCHASAVVIVPSDPCEFFAIERQKDSQTGEIRYIAAYDFHDLEEMGLLKQDVLGLKTVDVIANTIAATGEDIDIDNLPEADELTFQMLCEGHTMGCFQIESKGMTNTVEEIQPKSFWDLIPLVAIYRPGPKDAYLDGVQYEDKPVTMLKAYLLRRQGLLPVEYLHPKLEPILKPTYGVIIYQEQILQIARSLCGYTLGQADMLRRIIGRKQTDKIEKAMGEFCDLGIKNGISQEVIKQISEQIITFAKYGFNQGHSTAYGYIAYQTAYLKAHYPVQFMCSLINSKATEEVPGQVEECKRLGIQILPPDIRIGNTSWTMESGGIRVGISYIKFVGNAGVEYCSSFESFINTNTCNKRVIEYLIKSGAMDCYGNRALRLKDLCKINEEIASINAKITANREKITRINEKLNTTKDTTKAFQTLLTQLDNREMDIVKLNQKLKEVKELGKSLERYDEITGEVEALGFSLRDKNLYYDFSIAKRFNEDLHMPQIIGGDIVNLKEIKTRYGKPMAFVGIKTCFNESLEFAVFDKVLAKSNLMVGRTYLFAIEREGDKFRIADVRLPKRI